MLFPFEIVCMSVPNCVQFTPEEVEALIDRLHHRCLREEDYPLLADLLRAMIWLNVNLQEKKLTIQRLRAVFGIKTETAERLFRLAAGRTSAGQSDPGRQTSSDSESPPDSSQEKEGTDNRKPNHGHRPSSEYTEAKIIAVAHQTLGKGALCPSCQKGKLFSLAPGTVIHIVGQPWLQVEIYKPERLRCPVCGQIFTARLPQEVASSRTNHTAKAIVSLLKYRGGVPFYRQGQLQNILGAPVSPSEIWEMTEAVADDLLPVYGHLCSIAAQAELIQNDDTKARILSLIEERKRALEEERKPEKRTGTFTTGILASCKDLGVKVALFFTGRNHAGENLEALLEGREEQAGPPIQECDGGHNLPKNHQTQVAHCLAHVRRKFYELVELWPQPALKVVGLFALLFAHDQSAPSDPEERLKWHQDKSEPVMREMNEYCESLLKKREVEPNSSLGKAIAYFKNHWEGITLFLRVPGVPLTNNDTERLLKRAVLNRKNAYFYRNERGAKIGDILMSTIETCVLNHINPWNYLLAIQREQQEVRKNPLAWMPWNFQLALRKRHPP